MVLIDSTVWIDFLRGRSLETVARLRELLELGEAAIAPRNPHDCLIACVAVEHRIALLHSDKDFELFAQIEPGLVLV